jgi:hypothetical protein
MTLLFSQRGIGQRIAVLTAAGAFSLIHCRSVSITCSLRPLLTLILEDYFVLRKQETKLNEFLEFDCPPFNNVCPVTLSLAFLLPCSLAPAKARCRQSHQMHALLCIRVILGSVEIRQCETVRIGKKSTEECNWGSTPLFRTSFHNRHRIF